MFDVSMVACLNGYTGQLNALLMARSLSAFLSALACASFWPSSKYCGKNIVISSSS